MQTVYSRVFELSIAGQSALPLGVSARRARPAVLGAELPAVTAEVTNQDAAGLRIRVLKLERRVQWLLAIVRLLFTLVHVAVTSPPAGAG
jgi:hypothetical protein